MGCGPGGSSGEEVGGGTDQLLHVWVEYDRSHGILVTPKGSLQGGIVAHPCPRCTFPPREKQGVLLLLEEIFNRHNFKTLPHPFEERAAGTMSDADKKNILITGACGFIASHVCRDLVQEISSPHGIASFVWKQGSHFFKWVGQFV